MKNILVLMADMPNTEQVHEIWETEEEKKLSIDGLRRFYKKFAIKNLRQNPYINRDTGWKIRISAQGIGEIRKFRRREHIILVRILDSMLENSVLINIVPDEKSTPGIENVSYFSYNCKINSNAYSIRLTLKKAIGDDVHFFYYYKLSGC